MSSQTWPHHTQLRGSVCRFTHADGQASGSAAGHAQVPLVQIALARQPFRHEPQCAGSDVRSTHTTPAPVHFVAVVSQTHAPDVQVPSPQATSHEPQWRGSAWRSTQAVPQVTWPAGHWHWPPTHVEPAGHGWLQAPQAIGFVWRSMQAPVQSV